ncbi:hypothetical protein DKX38_018569 [Salix brachista]|uniref:Uncharacterized protein n=1 Tax=Salix brachista TaxID=2182728 RepID=A0A5N5KNE1_9ROSI|nr:hypothetical protein DKX38_018569 [Salix brachista]
MANKQFHILSSRTRSPTLLFTICPFAFSLLFSLFSLSTGHPSASPYSNTIPNLSLKPETSFVAALEHFKSSSSPFPTASEEDVPRFDDQVFPKSAIDLTENHTARWICQLGRMCQDSTIKTVSGLCCLSWMLTISSCNSLQLQIELISARLSLIQECFGWDGYYSWGLNQIAKAVSFSINDCKLVHGNVCLTSAVVTPTLDWKLNAFDVLSKFDG